jgi:hypothetical protein
VRTGVVVGVYDKWRCICFRAFVVSCDTSGGCTQDQAETADAADDEQVRVNTEINGGSLYSFC